MPLSAQRQEEILPDDIFQQERARRHFLNFVTYTKPDYDVNWHHEIICRELESLVRGEATRLILTMPPRFGKSELASRRLPAWILGRDPDAEIIACSYSADLAALMSRDVQRIVDNEKYAEIFPETKLSGSDIHKTKRGACLRTNDIFEIVGHRGVYRSAGIGGGITGMGAKYAIIDDPFKNRQDANSATIRQTIWEWYTSTLYTRLSPDGRVLIILTRWHEDDIVGRLLDLTKNAEDGEEWRVVSFPAVAESEREDTHPEDKRGAGEALWPARFSFDRLEAIKKAIGSYEWAGLYQQRPAPAGGGVFKEAWLRWYSPGALEVEMKAQSRGFDIVIQSWDMTFKDADSGDYVVGQVWARRGGDFYLLDQVRDKLNFTDSVAAVKMLSSKYPQAMTKLVEDKANGPAIIAHLQHEIFGLHPVNPEGSKESRAQAVTPLFESGNVYLPEPSACPWIRDFTSELLTFPSARHDDQVDAMAYALRHLATGIGNVAERLQAYGLDLNKSQRRQARGKRRRAV
jgi:predicted phage terminase large subunit-like protein